MATVRAATIWATVLAAASAAAGGEDLPRVTTVDGESFSGRLVSIARGEAIFRTAEASRSVPLTQMWSIRFGPHADLMARPGRTVVALTGEQRLGAEGLTVREGKVSLETRLLGAVTVDMGAVRAVYLPRGDQLPRACRRRHRQMRLPEAGHDYLIAQNDKGQWVPAPGVLKSVVGRTVAFEFGGRDRTIALDSVRVIELARVAGDRAAPAGHLIGTDGSRVAFESLTFAGGSLSISAEGLEAKSVDLAAVAEVRFASGRCVHLADLTPAKVAQVGLFDVAFGFRRDASTAGGPLSLDGVTYARGLGLHSRCELTYDLDAAYETFAATAGIDDAAGGRGNATLTVLGDGRELIRPVKLTGAGGPVHVRCDVTGVKRLTILVDFGDDKVDVGDHVDLAEARLVKP